MQAFLSDDDKRLTRAEKQLLDVLITYTTRISGPYCIAVDHYALRGIPTHPDFCRRVGEKIGKQINYFKFYRRNSIGFEYRRQEHKTALLSASPISWKY